MSSSPSPSSSSPSSVVSTPSSAATSASTSRRGFARDDDGDQAWPPLPPSLDPEVQELLKGMPAGPEDNMRLRMPIYHPLQPNALKDSSLPSLYYLDGTEVKGRPPTSQPPIMWTGLTLIYMGIITTSISYGYTSFMNRDRPPRVRRNMALNAVVRAVPRYVPYAGFCVFTSTLLFSAARYFTRYREHNMPVEPVLLTWAGIYGASKIKPLAPILWRHGQIARHAPLLLPLLCSGIAACAGYWWVFSRTGQSGDFANRITPIDPRAYEHVLGPAATAAAAARYDRQQLSQDFERFSNTRKSGADPRDSKWD